MTSPQICRKGGHLKDIACSCKCLKKNTEERLLFVPARILSAGQLCKVEVVDVILKRTT